MDLDHGLCRELCRTPSPVGFVRRGWHVALPRTWWRALKVQERSTPCTHTYTRLVLQGLRSQTGLEVGSLNVNGTPKYVTHVMQT